MKRNKRRFDRYFLVQQWWRTFNWEYTPHSCGDISDGYYCELTESEHDRIHSRACKAATQFANEICGRL